MRAELWLEDGTERAQELDAHLYPVEEEMDEKSLRYGIPANINIHNWKECKEIHSWADLILSEVYK